jgi:hypothetical protein
LILSPTPLLLLLVSLPSEALLIFLFDSPRAFAADQLFPAPPRPTCHTSWAFSRESISVAREAMDADGMVALEWMLPAPPRPVDARAGRADVLLLEVLEGTFAKLLVGLEVEESLTVLPAPPRPVWTRWLGRAVGWGSVTWYGILSFVCVYAMIWLCVDVREVVRCGDVICDHQKLCNLKVKVEWRSDDSYKLEMNTLEVV